MSVPILICPCHVVQRQVKEGIDAVIVDSVLAIRKGLTEHESKNTGSELPPSPPREQDDESNDESAVVIDNHDFKNGGVKVAN